MNKVNNRNAAGLGRSAIAERIRLREEWSALKGTDPQVTSTRLRQTNILTKKQANITKITAKRQPCAPARCKANESKGKPRNMQVTSEALRGVVALVETGSEARALPLRAALSALGASVLPAWSPLVTHLVWTNGGCRATRAKARALACRLVSPLWVEACAAGERRLPEQAFPAAARASDLPSPRTLRQLLKKAEMENMPIIDLLTDSNEDNKDPKLPRLRISSETEQDTSTDKTTDTSHDKSDNTTGVHSGVNTAPRRALPTSISISPHPHRPSKSRRKLFTEKETEVMRKGADSDSEGGVPAVPKRVKQCKLTQRDRKDLARAERMARRLLKTCTNAVSTPANNNVLQTTVKPKIVLTGMMRPERHAVCEAIRSLGGRIQSHVNKHTTHVLLGSFCAERDACGADHQFDITGVTTHVTTQDFLTMVPRSKIQNARTLKALAGAARGCRVLAARWATQSAIEKRWLHHYGYEVPHLRKVSQKARLERKALGLIHSDYGYDVFNGIRVYISSPTEQKDAAVHLLTLCGAVYQDGGIQAEPFDIKIGMGDGQVSSKWVFDSVAAGRMRTVRRYIIDSVPGLCNLMSNQ